MLLGTTNPKLHARKYFNEQVWILVVRIVMRSCSEIFASQRTSSFRDGLNTIL